MEGGPPGPRGVPGPRPSNLPHYLYLGMHCR